MHHHYIINIIRTDRNLWLMWLCLPHTHWTLQLHKGLILDQRNNNGLQRLRCWRAYLWQQNKHTWTERILLSFDVDIIKKKKNYYGDVWAEWIQSEIFVKSVYILRIVFLAWCKSTRSDSGAIYLRDLIILYAVWNIYC